MAAKLHIEGYIGRVNDTKGFELVDLHSFLATVPKNEDTLDITINSGGGDVEEGFAIYNTLINSKYTVNTTVLSLCGSIATVIFQAGKKGKRKMLANSEFFIHNPFFHGEIRLDADGATMLTDALVNAEDRILNVYQSVSTKETDLIKALMKKETTLSAQEALEFGFIDEVATQLANQLLPKYRIAAFIDSTTKNDNAMSAELKEEISGLKALITNAFKKFKLKNAMVETDKGALHFAEDVIAVGVKVYLDPEMMKPADNGDYLIGSEVFTVVDGVVTAAVAASTESPEVAALKEQLAAVQLENQTLKADKEGLAVDLVNVRTSLTKIEAAIVTKEIKASGSQGGADKGNGGSGEPAKTNMQKFAERKAAEAAKK